MVLTAGINYDLGEYLESVWLVKQRDPLDLCMWKDSPYAIDGTKSNAGFPYLSHEAISGFTFDIY